MRSQRRKAVYPLAVGTHLIWKQRMLEWSGHSSIFLFLDSNGYTNLYQRFECLLAAGGKQVLLPEGAVPDALAVWHETHRDWLFGHISYDFKNELEPRLFSRLPERVVFPTAAFYVPDVVCYMPIGSRELVIESAVADPDRIFNELCGVHSFAESRLPALHFRRGLEREEYLDTIGRLREHIAAGDCYEVNYCVEAWTAAPALDPLAVFRRLNRVSPAPFAAFYRLGQQYMMGASPERYLFGEGNRIVTQPIKGTARRDSDESTDLHIREQLAGSIKERAENVMIVDLVRNDLARSCEPGSVAVDELFAIYGFPQVYQMISTVSGTLRPACTFADAIRYSFPMGSMTGAPKVKVMELIERYERAKRGLFSGTVGYVTPGGDFDFNVNIRSLFYDAAGGTVSYQTGGAITYDSDPEAEWEELRLKAAALEQIFS